MAAPPVPALAPPVNAVGVIQSPVPANPASLLDIANAKDYVERLSASKREPASKGLKPGLPLALISLPDLPQARAIPTTDAEIGEAET